MGLQFRRGTDSDRLGVTPDIGEPLFTTNTKKLFIGDGLTAGGILISGTISDSADVASIITETVDSAYVNSRVDANIDSAALIAVVDSDYVQDRQDFAYSSLTGTPTTVSTFINDANYLDSTTVADVIDASYVQSNQITYNTSDFVDSAYVATQISNLVDGAPTALDTLNELATALQDDSDALASLVTVVDTKLNTSQVTSLVDSAYVQSRQTAQDFAYSSLTGAPTNLSQFNNNTNYLDSTTVTGVIDAAYVQANQTTYDFLDSAEVIGLVDSAYINARTDANIDSAALIALVDSAYVQARQTPQDFAYSSLTGAPTNVSSFTNDANYLDSTTVTGVIDATYIQANQTTYDFLDSAEVIGLVDSAYVQARQSNPDQSLNTTDSVEFAALDITGNVVIGGNLQVDGTQTVINTQNLAVQDNMFYLNQLESDGSPTLIVDVGWVANVNDDGSYAHVGMFRDATDNTFKVFDQYTPEPDSASQIDTSHPSFNLAPFAARTLTGQYLGFDSDVTAAGLATQSYVITTIDSDYINARTDANIDSAALIALVDSAYVQARQAPGTDSAEVQNIITGFVDSAYINARVSSTDSAAVVGIINATVDSDYVATFIPDGTFRGLRTYTFTTDSGDTIISGTDDNGNNLIYSKNTVAVYVNGILLVDGVDYTTSDSSSITLAEGADSADIITIHNIVAGGTDSALINQEILSLIDSDYINARVVIPEAGVDSASVLSIVTSDGFTKYDSVDTLGLIDSAYIQARQDFAYSSLTGIPTAVSTFTNDANYLDSTTVTGVIDASYIQANQITYNTSDFVDSAYVATQISNLVDGAPTALDTLNELATALQNDSDALAALITVVDTKLNTAGVISLVDSAYVQARQSPGTDSAEVQNIITGFVDSAYIAARSSGTGGLDSAAILALIDSDYVAARSSSGGSSINVTFYEYLPDSGATTISGNDRDGNSLAYQLGNIQVFRNGILLIDSNDYQATNGSSVTLSTSAVSGDYISIAAYSEGVNVQVKDYSFTADSGQTTFTGLATNGEVLSYTPNNLLVHLNGILLVDSADYTATSGSSVILTAAADLGDNLSVVAFTNASSANQFVEAISSINAAAGKKYIVDTSSAVTITLPASSTFGDEIKVIDGTGNAAANNITINRNGHKILGGDSDFTLDVNRVAVDLVYYNVTQGWIVSGNT